MNPSVRYTRNMCSGDTKRGLSNIVMDFQSCGRLGGRFEVSSESSGYRRLREQRQVPSLPSLPRLVCVIKLMDRLWLAGTT